MNKLAELKGEEGLVSRRTSLIAYDNKRCNALKGKNSAVPGMAVLEIGLLRWHCRTSYSRTFPFYALANTYAVSISYDSTYYMRSYTTCMAMFSFVYTIFTPGLFGKHLCVLPGALFDCRLVFLWQLCAGC